MTTSDNSSSGGVPAGEALVHIAEVFGPTIQGEGPATGHTCMFIRLGGCNLRCGGCDTPYTWDGARYDLRREITPVPAAEVVAEVATRAGQAGRRPNLVVLTGGEPLIHQHTSGMHALVTGLAGHGFTVHV